MAGIGALQAPGGAAIAVLTRVAGRAAKLERRVADCILLGCEEAGREAGKQFHDLAGRGGAILGRQGAMRKIPEAQHAAHLHILASIAPTRHPKWLSSRPRSSPTSPSSPAVSGGPHVGHSSQLGLRCLVWAVLSKCMT